MGPPRRAPLVPTSSGRFWPVPAQSATPPLLSHQRLRGGGLRNGLLLQKIIVVVVVIIAIIVMKKEMTKRKRRIKPKKDKWCKIQLLTTVSSGLHLPASSPQFIY